MTDNSEGEVSPQQTTSNEDSQNENKKLSTENPGQSVRVSLAGIPGRNFESFDAAAKGLVPGYRELPVEKRRHAFKYRKLYGCSGTYKESIEFAKKRALFEERNIAIILHAGLSAFSDRPINVMLIAPPSEGKTHVITNALSVFPDQYVSIYRDASPKSFTRERGQLAVRVIRNGVKEYKTTIFNEFTGEEITIESYLRWLKSELQNKGIKKEDKEAYQEKLLEIQDNLVTLIPLENRIIAFLDRPSPELWRSLLSILSHDSYYTESMFVEGDGVKETKHIVFRGWPAFIFATTKDEAKDFQDLESRFEICEPVMTPEKYQGAIEADLNFSLGVKQSEDDELKKIKAKVDMLIQVLTEQKVNALAPIEPAKMFEILFKTDSRKIQHGDLMRKIPRMFEHVKMSALWNLPDRVLLTNDDEKSGPYVVISAEDLKVLPNLYGDIGINALLSGLPTSNYEFLTRVLQPAFDSTGPDESSVEQKEIFERLKKYTKETPATKLKSDKMAFNRYLKFPEERGYIVRDTDEKDKRKKTVTLLVPFTEIIDSIEDGIKKIGTSAISLSPQYIGSLLNRNFTAFQKMEKIGTTLPEMYRNDKNKENQTFPETLSNTDFVVNSILMCSGYIPITSGEIVPNFDKNDGSSQTRKKTGSGEEAKKTESQKHNEIARVPNFDLTEEEVLFITYIKKKIHYTEIKKNWHSLDPPSYQKVLDIATKFNIDNNPYARYENGFMVWTGERWS